jgi:hypothetical protein
LPSDPFGIAVFVMVTGIDTGGVTGGEPPPVDTGAEFAIVSEYACEAICAGVPESDAAIVNVEVAAVDGDPLSAQVAEVRVIPVGSAPAETEHV